jgi:hypothetical protein
MQRIYTQDFYFPIQFGRKEIKTHASWRPHVRTQFDLNYLDPMPHNS